MAGFEISRVVNAPLERVFDVFTDIDRLVHRHSEIVKIERLTQGPVGKGTVFRETRVVFGREFTTTMEFTEFERCYRWVIGCQSYGSRLVCAYDLQPEGEGTRLIVHTVSKPMNPIAWLMGITAPLLMRICKSATKKDLDQLVEVAEGDDSSAPDEPTGE